MIWWPYAVILFISILCTIYSYLMSNRHGTPVLRRCLPAMVVCTLYRALFQCLIFALIMRYWFRGEVSREETLAAAVFSGLVFEAAFYSLLGIMARLIWNIDFDSSKPADGGWKISQALQRIRPFLALNDYIERKVEELKVQTMVALYEDIPLRRRLNKVFEVVRRGLLAPEQWKSRAVLFSKKFYILVETLGYGETLRRIHDPATDGLFLPWNGRENRDRRNLPKEPLPMERWYDEAA